MEINISKKLVKQFCTDCAQVTQATDKKGTLYYAKLINIEKSVNGGYDDSLEYNTEVLEDTIDMIFRENVLDIKTQISNEQMVGLIIDPYDYNLSQFILQESLGEREALEVFDQVLRGVYSVYMVGYWHRNIRAEHFVRCGKVWRLESLVLNENYSKANGAINEYLWSSQHEAPEFELGRKYSDEDYNIMTVWNLGALLLHLITGSHRLTNRTVTDKFAGKPFSFEAIGIKSDKVTRLSPALKDTLASMLHHSPTQRMKLQALFQNRLLSEVVAKHAISNKGVMPSSKISVGKSVRSSNLNFESKNILNDISKTINEKQKERDQLLGSRINNVVDEEEFLGNLQEISNRIPSKEFKGLKEKQGPRDMEELVGRDLGGLRRPLELYKSYFDQAELLMLAIDDIDKLQFVMFIEEAETKEVKLLIRHTVVFVSLITLNTLAQGFNQNRNILDLDGDKFTLFQSSPEYKAFQKIVNFKRTERARQLDTLRQEIAFFKKKNLSKELGMVQLLQHDFKKCTFSEIKVPYRMIVKYAYDSISELYNRLKKTQRGLQLAQRAMFVTYCLTIDKLYIKEHIPDNFKYYFEWIGKTAGAYVPLNDFKHYILTAPKELLIEHSRFILKKYYNI